ncbi:MAG: carbon-phosphorus lyase complex subunit PhnI [Clostridiales Family XIII bacterium]|jgi:alpha-D-ribose 1-methylphosphonate 5-triphosphate synthase subunit PhnI|nr:carbon-phosphorus lyase complex subunit PhnI [Clostridiales Family XIII bacterium]
MGYVAVQGGAEAIKEANLLAEYNNCRAGRAISVEDIRENLKKMVDSVMSESSLYSPELAALAIKQAQGDPAEAVFLLRAHRSTLPRLYFTTVTDTAHMRVERRISAAFKDIPGGQILGDSPDYRHRLLDYALCAQSPADAQDFARQYEANIREASERTSAEQSGNRGRLPKLVDFLRSQNLVSNPDLSDEPPHDITTEPLVFPSARSSRLQILTRGMTGAVTALGYAKIRGFGISHHPNIGELRVGSLPLHILSDLSGAQEEYYIGEIEATEAEIFMEAHCRGEEAENVLGIGLGYGLCFGRNETKAIAMGVLEHSMENPGPGDPTSDEEFVLLHVDAVESTGFVSHLKLPHYVTFRSKLDRIRNIRKEQSRV